MGRKGPRAKTKTVLKSVSKWAQFGSMQNLKFQTLPDKNPPSDNMRASIKFREIQLTHLYDQNPASVLLLDLRLKSLQFPHAPTNLYVRATN